MNAKLGADQPFRVRSATLHGVAVQIPWSDLAAEHVLLQVERVAVTLAPYDPAVDVVLADADANEHLMSRSITRSALAGSNMNQSTLGAGSVENAFANDPWMAGAASASSHQHIDPDAAELGAAFADSGDGSKDTKTALEHLFANIFANLQVQLDALDVRLEYAADAALALALRGVVYKSRDDVPAGGDVVRKVLIFESLTSSIDGAEPLSLFSLVSTGADMIAVDFSRKALEEVTGVEEQPQSLSIVANIDGDIRLALTPPIVGALSQCATVYARAASLLSSSSPPSSSAPPIDDNDAVMESMSQSILLRLSPYSRWRPRTATLLSEATLLKVRLRHVEGVWGAETLHFHGIVAKHVFVERASELGCGLIELTDGLEPMFRCGDKVRASSDDDGDATPPIWLRVTDAAQQQHQRANTSERNLVVVIAPVHILVAPQRVQRMIDLVAPLLRLPRFGKADAVAATPSDPSKQLVRVSWPAPLQFVCRVPEAQLECTATLRNASCALIVSPNLTRASASFDVFELIVQRTSARKTKTKRTSAAATRRASGAALLRYSVSGARASVIEVRLRSTAGAEQSLALPTHRDDALWSMAQVMLVQQEPAAARQGFDARQHIGSAFALKNADVCVQAALCDIAINVDSVADVVQCVQVVQRMLPATAAVSSPPTQAPSPVSIAAQVRVDSVEVDLEAQFALRLQNLDSCVGTRYARLPVTFAFCGASHLSLMRDNNQLMLCGTPTGLIEQLPPVLPELVVNVEGASVRTVVGSQQTTFIVTRLSLVPHAPNWLALIDIVKSASPSSAAASASAPPPQPPSSPEFGVAIRHINVLHLSGLRRSGALCIGIDNVSGRANLASSAHVSVQSVSVHLLAPPSSGGECPRRWIPSSSSSSGSESSFIGSTVGLFRSREAVGHASLDVNVALGSSPLVAAIDAQANVLRMRFTKAQFAALNDVLATLGAAAGAYFDIPLPQLPDDSAEAERLQRKALLEETLRAAFARERQQQQQQQQASSEPIDMGGSIVLNANEIEDELSDMRGSMLLVESDGSGGAPASEERVQSEVDAVMRSTEWIVMQDDVATKADQEPADQAPTVAGRSWSLPVDEAFAHTPLAVSLQLSRFGVSVVLAGEPNAAAAAAASTAAASTFDALELRLHAPLIRFEQFQLAESVRPANGDLATAVKQHPAHFYDQFTPHIRCTVRFDLFDIRDHVLTSSYKRAFRICESADGATVGELRVEFLAHQRWSPAQRKLAVVAHVPPMRAYVNQDSWDFLWQYLARDDTPIVTTTAAQSDPPPAPPLPTLLELLEVTPISIVVDYKPGIRAGSFSALMATGDYMYMLKMVPLEQASVELRHLRLRNVLAENWSSLALQRYFPNYDRSHLARLLVGVQPLHVAFKLGAGAADLVRVPLAEYRRGGSVVAGLQSGVKTLTVEVLTLGSRVSSVAARLLGGGSDTAALRASPGGSSDEQQRISRYANQPATMNEGVQQAVEQLRDGVLSGLRAVAVDPINAYQRDGAWAFLSSAVSGVPRLVLRPAMGVSSAIAKVTQGVRNQLEPERKREADHKWKAANDDNQLDDFEM